MVGASGHLGRELVRQLIRRGDHVRAVDRAAGAEAIDGADVVFHLDGRVSMPDGGDPLAPVDSSSVDPLLRACDDGRARRLVHISSLAAILPGRTPTSDELVRRAALGGVDVVTVHPTAIIGPDDPGPGQLDRLLLDLWQRRQPAPVGGGFDWVDVRDVATGAVAAAGSAPPGGRYLLGGHWATVEEVVARATRITAELTGEEAPPLVVPDPPAATAAAAGGDDALDPAPARRDLGYAPRPLEETLRDTLRWFAGRDLAADPRRAAALVPA